MKQKPFNHFVVKHESSRADDWPKFAAQRSCPFFNSIYEDLPAWFLQNAARWLEHSIYSLSNNDSNNNNNNIIIFSFGLWGNIKKEVLQEERK